MTTYTQEVTNKSFLSNNKFEFVIDRLPHLEFFIQSITIPDITLAGSQLPTPYTYIPIPSSLLNYGELTMTYIMDEDMKAWREVYDWMYNLGNPESMNKIGTLTRDPGQINSVTSDASLLIKTNSNNPNLNFIFHDIFPTTLGGVTLTTNEGQEFLTGTVNFFYTHYHVKSV